MNQTKKKNEKGFTMIELIIVVAIMAIIGAVLVPTFNNMSIKARLTTDVTSIKTLQRQLDVYKAEKGSYPAKFITSATAADMSEVLNDLTQGYIDKKDLSGTSSTTYALKLQSGGTIMVADNKCYLNFDTSAKGKEYGILANTIDSAAKDWVRYNSLPVSSTNPTP